MKYLPKIDSEKDEFENSELKKIIVNTEMWMVAQTQSIEEAKRISNMYEMKGFKTTIIELPA